MVVLSPALTKTVLISSLGMPREPTLTIPSKTPTTVLSIMGTEDTMKSVPNAEASACGVSMLRALPIRLFLL